MNRLAAFTLALGFVAAGATDAGNPVTTVAPTYEASVRPILKAYCFHCHGDGEKPKGSLDLRLRRLILDGGDSGPAIEPGSPENSLLYHRIEAGEMPPGEKKLAREQIETIGRWIRSGAKTVRPEPAGRGRQLDFTLEEREHWSFQPVRQPAVPRVRHTDLVRTPIDAFLLARLEANGLSFTVPADRVTLIRRAYFDLLGLPPPPAEVDRFLADRQADAYERLIDRLLASPQYGERWGRHWLDVAGYADSDGYTDDDPVRKYAFKYRDYVIQAFNRDQPFNDFIGEQLAGDEMVGTAGKPLAAAELEKLIATGFLRMAPDGTGSGGADPIVARNQVVAETIKIVSTSLLGLSVGCAQCHNHRYDPIPQTDYYRLRAVFEPALDCKNWRPPQARLVSLATAADRLRSQQVETEASKIDAERLQKQRQYLERTLELQLAKVPVAQRERVRAAYKAPRGMRSPEQKRLLKEFPSVNVSPGSLYLYDAKAADDLKTMAARAAAVRAKKPVEDFVAPLTEVPGTVPATYLFQRGDPTQPKQSLQPGGLTILTALGLPSIPVKDPTLPTTGRRRALARWLTDPRQPLTARVLVNRVWMHHFGRGIVGTPADFGMQGEPPTHPELLDWLASEWVAGGWRLKRLHRLIMTSTAYCQVSQRSSRTEAADPDNRLLGHMAVRRLEAEAVRDSILAVSGKLNRKMFGSSVPVMEDEDGQFVVGIENKNGENRPGPVIPLHGEEYRRSLYVQVRRSRPLAVLSTFDAPAMEPNCEARTASTVAPQSLLLMNNDFVLEQAGAFADRLEQAAPDLRAQVYLGWRLALSRVPTPEQIEQAVAFIEDQARHAGNPSTPADKNRKKSSRPPTVPTTPRHEALALFCQALLNANAFLYVD